MPRRSQVPLRLERLTWHSGSQPELTAHPSPETPLRDHFGSVELQVALARALRQDSTEPATPPLPAQVWLWLGNLRLQALPATSSRNITSTSESFGSGIYPSQPEPIPTATTSLIILPNAAKQLRVIAQSLAMQPENRCAVPAGNHVSSVSPSLTSLRRDVRKLSERSAIAMTLCLAPSKCSRRAAFSSISRCGHSDSSAAITKAHNSLILSSAPRNDTQRECHTARRSAIQRFS